MPGVLQPADQRTCDATDHVILNLEEILHVPVVAFRPNVVAGLGLDELRGDADTASRLPHTALDDVLDAELAPHVLNHRRLVLVVERGVSSDDKERAEARQLRCDVLGYAIGEIFLLRITRHVREGKNGYRDFVMVSRKGYGRWTGDGARTNTIYPHRFGDVLELSLAKALEVDLDLALDLPVGVLR